MTLSNHDRNDYLLVGLVGTEHADLFDTNAYFHASVHAVAALLPVIVRALADEAVQQQARDEQLRQQIAAQQAYPIHLVWRDLNL